MAFCYISPSLPQTGAGVKKEYLWGAEDLLGTYYSEDSLSTALPYV